MSLKTLVHEMIHETKVVEAPQCIDRNQNLNSRALWGRTHASQAFHAHINSVATAKQPVFLWKYGNTDPTDIAELIHRKSSLSAYQLATVSCRTNPFESWAKAFAQLVDPHNPNIATLSPDCTSILPGGTLYLNDLEFLPRELQCLLYALLDKEGMIRFLGSNAQGVEIRVVASSTSDIWRKCQEGLFQSNLFCQLNRLSVHCPSNLIRSTLNHY